MAFNIKTGGIIGAIMAAAAGGTYYLTPNTWNKLTVEGHNFQLDKRQDVRFGNNSIWAYKTNLIGPAKCDKAFFGMDNPPAGALRCEAKYGPPTPPAPTGAPTIHSVGVAVAASGVWPVLPGGSATQDLTGPYAIDPPKALSDWEGAGDQRTFCNGAQFGFNDPIVLPGQPNASHLHAFFGNTVLDAYTTSADIRTRNSPTGTCLGGIANLSGYWVPAMLNMTDSAGTKGVPVEGVMLLYYKASIQRYIGVTGRNSDGSKIAPPPITALPIGLRMVTGIATLTAPGNSGGFQCHFRDIDYNMANPNGAADDPGILPTYCPNRAPNPSNPSGDPAHKMDIWQHLDFGQCWSGQLDSPNHRDHITGAIGGAHGPYNGDPNAFDPDRQYQCPAGFPYVLVHITLIPEWPTSAGSGASKYVLASDAYAIDSATGLLKDATATPRGYSAHGDWMNGWDPVIVGRWTDHCMAEAERRNCGVGGLGDGYGLAPNHGSDGSHRGNP